MKETPEMKSGITVTEKAAVFIQRILQRQEKALGIRIGVIDAGCSGKSYNVKPAEEINAGDLVFESGVTVVVDANSFPILQGTEIDLKTVGLREELLFNNPNVTHACGCGESFTVK